jgi:hypothetical protein
MYILNIVDDAAQDKVIYDQIEMIRSDGHRLIDNWTTRLDIKYVIMLSKIRYLLSEMRYLLSEFII